MTCRGRVIITTPMAFRVTANGMAPQWLSALPLQNGKMVLNFFLTHPFLTRFLTPFNQNNKVYLKHKYIVYIRSGAKPFFTDTKMGPPLKFWTGIKV